MDQMRMAFGEACLVKPKLPHRPRHMIFHQHIRPRQKPVKDVAALSAVQIKCYG